MIRHMTIHHLINKKNNTIIGVIICFITAFLIIADSFAVEMYDKNQDTRINGTIKIDARTGYRRDSLEWNIAGNIYGQNPNILSELEFTDIEIYQAGIEINAMLNRFYSRGSVFVGTIVDGTGMDSDYTYDNRHGLWSRSQFKIKDNNVYDLDLGVGYELTFFYNKFTAVPLIGLSYHKQNLRFTDGVQIIPDSGPFPGLNSTYKTEWKSWWLGIDMCYKISNIHLMSSLEYHRADYEASADWNLIDDFQHPVSFIHTADGDGIVIDLGINYILSGNWSAGFNYCYYSWSTDAGYDTVFLATGQAAVSRLNEVKWESRSFNLSISYKF